MKTLLLALVVVTFVCLDFGNSLECCKDVLCLSAVQCSSDTAVCTKTYTKSLIGTKMNVQYGCASNCTLPEEGGYPLYCSGNRCSF
nr:three-finger toxin [Rhabdophis subminiatus]